MNRIQSLRGMVDILPEDCLRWQMVEDIARKHFLRAGIKEIRTPILEVTDLFLKGIGESTDVVGKEMYTFNDRGNRSCTLRPEGTASVARAIIQNGLLSNGPLRLWYGGPMFRYERPQAGRQRQFHQIGVEFVGYDSVRSDVEIISIAWDFLTSLGLDKLKLEINSLGTDEDRRKYRSELVVWLKDNYELLDQDSQKRISQNPLRILDSKDPETQKLLLKAPSLIQFLSDDSRERFEYIQILLAQLKIPFEINHRLVRGLDYYSHTAFEITSDQLGSQATVCGGGRYDTLIGDLDGGDIHSIGWAIGMERLILLLDKSTTPIDSIEVYVINQGLNAEKMALDFVRQLRIKGISIELDYSGASFSKQFKRANKSGAKWALIIGEDELKRKEIRLKNLRAISNPEVNKDYDLSVFEFDKLVSILKT